MNTSYNNSEEQLILVTKIQRFSVHDGPGIRTTVFLAGCPLSCFWCHNPETQLPKPQLMLSPETCIGCGKCLEVCPSGAHTAFDGKHIIDRTICRSCFVCADNCVGGALSVSAKYMTVKEIMKPVLSDAAFYSVPQNEPIEALRIAGGLTLSGGEPLMFPDNALLLLSAAKQYRISTAVETCGQFDSSRLDEIAELTDVFLWDFKDGVNERHRKNTGVSNEHIIRNLLAADKFGIPIILRCILISGVNNDEAHLNAISDIYSKLKNCAKVQLLPYHPYGGVKYSALGRSDDTDSKYIPSTDTVEEFCTLLREKGVPAEY